MKMYNEIRELKDTLESNLSDKRFLEKQLTDTQVEIQTLKDSVFAGKKGVLLIQEIGKATQKKVEDLTNKMVTHALKAVDPEDFPEFKMEMVSRRNQIECDMFLSQNGIEADPLFGFAGGVKDITSFALFLSYWSMNKNRPVLFLDEPFRNVSTDLQAKVSEMLQSLCAMPELGITIIMVSHEDEINAQADKVLWVKQSKGVSRVS